VNNPKPVPVSAAAGSIEIDRRHGVTVIVRDFAHIRAGFAVAKRLAARQGS
jgi:hypothetical protein